MFEFTWPLLKIAKAYVNDPKGDYDYYDFSFAGYLHAQQSLHHL